MGDTLNGAKALVIMRVKIINEQKVINTFILKVGNTLTFPRAVTGE
jgi:hypothetical protein